MDFDLNDFFNAVADMVKEKDPEKVRKQAQVQVIQEAFKIATCDEMSDLNGHKLSKYDRQHELVGAFIAVLESLDYSEKEARKFLLEAVTGDDIEITQ